MLQTSKFKVHFIDFLFVSNYRGKQSKQNILHTLIRAMVNQNMTRKKQLKQIHFHININTYQIGEARQKKNKIRQAMTLAHVKNRDTNNYEACVCMCVCVCVCVCVHLYEPTYGDIFVSVTA